MTKKIFCDKCESGDIFVEVMFSVNGQEGNSPKQIDVANCKGCGHRWSLK